MQHEYWGFPVRTSIRILDENGILCPIYPFAGWRGELIGRDYSKEPYFQEAKKKSQNAISYLINEQGDKRVGLRFRYIQHIKMKLYKLEIQAVLLLQLLIRQGRKRMNFKGYWLARLMGA